MESLKVRKGCPLCKTAHQRRSVKKNNVLGNVVACYQAMDELVRGGPSASGTPRGSAASTPIKSAPRQLHEEQGDVGDSPSQATLTEIVELKRQLRDQERAIAEIDALLAETNYASAAPTVNGNLRGTKRRSSSSTPTSQVFDHANGATSPSPTKRARIDKGQDMDEERTAGGAEEEVEKEVNDKEQNNEEQVAEEDQEKTSADATSTGNEGDNMEEEKEESEEEPKGKKRTKQKTQEKQASATKRSKKKDVKEAKSSPTSSATKFVLLGTGLDAQKTRKLRRLASKHGGKVVSDFTSNVTHVVTPDENHTARRTLKFMLGLLNGLWIVNFAWVTSCLDAGKYVSEEPFEISSDTVGKGGPAKGRKSAGGKALFEGYSFYLHGSFQAPSPSKDDLKTLITTAGGTFLSRSPPSPKKATAKRGRKKKSTEPDEPSAPPVAAGADDGRTVVLCDVGCSAKQAKEAQQMCARRPVSVLWLLDSISHFKPQALESYVLLNDE